MVRTVAVDLDGCLARYSGEWRGPAHIGEPLPGAVEAMAALVEMAFHVVVFTCRIELNEKWVDGLPREELIRIVEDWLRDNAFPAEMSVWTEGGKPMAEYYLDDRAIHVEPQRDPDAWEWALHIIQLGELQRATQ